MRRLTDEVGPRLAGSPGDRAAVAWGQALFRELGFANVRAEEVPVTAWERGVETAEVVSPFPQRLVVTALGGSVGTPAEGITAPVVEMKTLEALEEAVKADPDAVRGKIVFFSRRMVKGGQGPGYGANVPMRSAGRREGGAARRARRPRPLDRDLDEPLRAHRVDELRRRRAAHPRGRRLERRRRPPRAAPRARAR